MKESFKMIEEKNLLENEYIFAIDDTGTKEFEDNNQNYFCYVGRKIFN